MGLLDSRLRSKNAELLKKIKNVLMHLLFFHAAGNFLAGQDDGCLALVVIFSLVLFQSPAICSWSIRPNPSGRARRAVYLLPLVFL
jgi:hypothetical protein